MQEIRDWIPLLIPVFVIWFVLIVTALWDLAKRPKTRGPKWLWVLIILFVNFLGPILYFVLGRED